MEKSEKKNLLICDSNLETRALIKEAALEIYPKWTIVEAAQTNEGYSKALRQKFDLIILEIKSTSRDGETFISSLESMSGNLRPKAILAMFENSNDIPQENFNNFVTYLSKPCSFESIKSTIKSILTPKINVEFINPFINAAIYILSSLASVKATKEKVFIQTHEHMNTDISALIAINSSSVTGSMAISFESKSFLNIVNKMLGENHTEINEQNFDAAGEICNQIFGSAKTHYNKNGYDLKPAIPSVITGNNVKIHHLIPAPVIAVQLQTEAGLIILETCIGSTQA